MIKRKRTQKRLAMWSALPAYLGGKRRLCPIFFREIDQIIPRRYWHNLTFLDAFLGGNSVSLFAKAQAFQVIGTDIAERAIVVGKALIENCRTHITREDILKLVATTDTPPGRIEREYVPSVFTMEQGRFLDNVLRVASETHDETKAALFKLLALRVSMLAHPMSDVRKGTIHRLETGEYENITESCLHHYIDGWRLTKPKKLMELAKMINAGVFQGQGKVLKQDILETIPNIKADVLYADPPYPGVMSYEKKYKIIDEMLEGASRPTSPFTKKDGAAMVDVLFEKANHIPVWLLSLGNEVVGLDELEEKMKKFGRVTKAIKIKHQHLGAVATEEKKKRNLELFVVGYDPDSDLIKKVSDSHE